MNELRLTNDINELYQQDYVQKSGGIACPVCGKVYKREKALQKHMEEQDCYDIKALFGGTQIELNALDLFQSMNEKGKMTMFMFRRNRGYNPIMKFILACITNEIKDVGLFYSYVDQIKHDGKAYTNKVLADARKVETVREYRLFLQQNPEYIENEQFLERNREELLSNPNFLIRSIEKSHIALEVIIDGDDEMRSALLDLPEDYYNRMEAIYEKIGRRD